MKKQKNGRLELNRETLRKLAPELQGGTGTFTTIDTFALCERPPGSITACTIEPPAV